MPSYRDLQLETKTREKLAEELRELTKEAESLITSSGEDLAQQAEDIQKKLKAAMDLFSIGYESIGERAKAGAKAADKVIRRNPYAAIGVALGAGVLLGLLIKRK
jgi:ElaB/YqjD/DUF883 family membrane-anchored ribosome-binding protein